MLRSAPVDDFRLAYERAGGGPGVVLLHGWPGARHDYREVLPRLAEHADVVLPDLRGFGDSDRMSARRGRLTRPRHRRRACSASSASWSSTARYWSATTSAAASHA